MQDENISVQYKKYISKSRSRPGSSGSQMSSILWTATSNRSLSAMVKWDGLEFSPRAQPGFFTLSCPDSWLPSHSSLWFSSLPFLPPSPLSPWSSSVLHYFFPRHLTLISTEGMWPATPICLVCNTKFTLTYNISVWVIHSLAGHGVKRPTPTCQGLEEELSLGVGN